MTLNAILNSDLSKIVREIRRGYDWWIEELASLVPSTLRTWHIQKTKFLMIDDQYRLLNSDGSPVDNSADNIFGEKATILLSKATVLVRNVTTPPMTRTDLLRMLDLNSDRYFPLPNGSVLLTHGPPDNRREEGLMQTDLAAIPLERARHIADALKQSNVRPHSVKMSSACSAPDSRFDFLPAMQKAGLVDTGPRISQKWWVVVGILAALNVATMIWRDSTSVAYLQNIVDTQQPGVAVAQRMASRMRSIDAIAHGAAGRRGLDDSLTVLAQTTAAIPDGAWVQRYAWDGTALRLTGYRSRDADVTHALRRVPVFVNVKSAQTESVAETVTGQPFDITADIRKR